MTARRCAPRSHPRSVRRPARAGSGVAGLGGRIDDRVGLRRPGVQAVVHPPQQRRPPGQVGVVLRTVSGIGGRRLDMGRQRRLVHLGVVSAEPPDDLAPPERLIELSNTLRQHRPHAHERSMRLVTRCRTASRRRLRLRLAYRYRLPVSIGLRRNDPISIGLRRSDPTDRPRRAHRMRRVAPDAARECDRLLVPVCQPAFGGCEHIRVFMSVDV
jgi:hypothetical protein